MKFQPKCCILFVFLVTLVHITAIAQKADIIITNGKIFTADFTQLYVQALVIRGNKILAVCTNKVIEGLATATTKRERLEHNYVCELTDAKRKAVKEMGMLMMHTSWYCMASPIRSLLDDGIMLGIAPDGTTNPFIEIMLMTITHANPKENLTVEQAFIAYTRTNAYAEFKEKEKGTLAKGMLADLVVLSQDIFTVAPQQLPATKSVLTMIDGKIVYQPSLDLDLIISSF